MLSVEAGGMVGLGTPEVKSTHEAKAHLEVAVT